MGTTTLSSRCHSAHSEAIDMKQRFHRENAALGSEISRVRAATTSLTQGVLRSLQILGILHESPEKSCDPSRTSPWGVDVADLVEWEKTGRSLADRVAEGWSSTAPASVATLLELVQ